MPHPEESVLDPAALSASTAAHLKKHRASLLEVAENGRGVLRIEGKDKTETVLLPQAYLPILARALAEVSEGNCVTMTPAQKELSTQEAASLLNVSRPHVISDNYISRPATVRTPGSC